MSAASYYDGDDAGFFSGNNKIIGLISIFIHVIFTAFMLVAPFVTADPNMLMFLIFLNAALITEWYVLGGSVLNQFDCMAYSFGESRELTYHTGLPASLPVICAHRLTGIDVPTLGQLTACIPLVYISYMLVKLKKIK